MGKMPNWLTKILPVRLVDLFKGISQTYRNGLHYEDTRQELENVRGQLEEEKRKASALQLEVDRLSAEVQEWEHQKSDQFDELRTRVIYTEASGTWHERWQASAELKHWLRLHLNFTPLEIEYLAASHQERRNNTKFQLIREGIDKLRQDILLRKKNSNHSTGHSKGKKLVPNSDPLPD